MLDHITLRVSNAARSKAFYTAALRPLGYSLTSEFVHEGATVAGWSWRRGDGSDKTDWWIVQAPRGSKQPISGPTHVALLAADRARVRAFHAAALSAGGRDNGAPGLRPHYHADYYGAFVLDPDGNNIEAVCHAKE